MASSQNAPKIQKTAPKKKSSKGSASFSSTESTLHETTQLFSLDTMDYGESIRVMIELTCLHPIAILHTDTPNPSSNPLYTAFERIRMQDGVLETKITGNRIVPVSYTHLRAHET